MRSSSGGLLTTLLMFVPLVAVPALAIFGVPNPGGLKASLDPAASNAPLDLDGEPSLGGPVKIPSRSATEEGEGFLPGATPFPNEDPFMDISAHLRDEKTGDPDSAERLRRANPEGSRANPEGSRANGEGSRPSRSGANTPTRLRDEMATTENPFERPVPGAAGRSKQPLPHGPAGDRDRKSAIDDSAPRDLKRTAEIAPDAAGAVGDWRSAIRRLKDLGITEYQLVPGEADGGFLFTCQYPSPDNPRITHRFEAEAAEPLEAVRDVLAQLERVLPRR